MLNISHVLDLPNCQDVFISQDNKSQVILYTVIGGKVVQTLAENLNGTWKNLQFNETDVAFMDENVTGIEGATEDANTRKSLIILQKEGLNKIVSIPDTQGNYSTKSPYRIYHGYDTKRTYQNVADSWQLIATLHHDELYETGKYTHEDIDNYFDTIPLEKLLKRLDDLAYVEKHLPQIEPPLDYCPHYIVFARDDYGWEYECFTGIIEEKGQANHIIKNYTKWSWKIVTTRKWEVVETGEQFDLDNIEYFYGDYCCSNSRTFVRSRKELRPGAAEKVYLTI